MKRKLIIMISLLLVSSMLMCACDEPGGESGAETSVVSALSDTEPVSVPEQSANADHQATTLVVDSVADLRALTVTADEMTVTLLGFYEPGDGGQGIFFWNDRETAPDDGGIYIKCANEKGRFVRLCEDCDRNVKWFGAKGDGRTDDAAAIQAAIDSLPAHGGTVSLPGGTYVVSRTLDIGNGNAKENWSTKHGVALVGSGSGQGVHSSAVPTTVIASAAMESVISVHGLIADVSIKGINVTGNLKAKNGIFLNAFCGLRMSDVRITQFTEKGLYILAGEAPTGNYNIYNRFENVNAVSGANGACCLYMDGCYEVSNDTWLSTFTQCVFDTSNGVGSSAAYFKFVDSISFYSCRFKAEEGSSGIVFDALDNNDFPSGLGFYSCSVSSVKVLEDDEHRMRKSYFYGFSTSDGEIIPEHNRIIGITDTGIMFNMEDVIGGGSGGGFSSLPGKKGLVDLFNNGEWNHYNLAKSKKAIGVHINCNGKLTGGKAYLPNYNNTIGTVHIKVYKWDTDYATSVAGEVLSYYDFVNFEENNWTNFTFSTQLEPGEYVVEFTAETEDDDYGCGVWTQNKGSGVVTYYDGSEVEFGVTVSLDIQ